MNKEGMPRLRRMALRRGYGYDLSETSIPPGGD
jgi:hypothetical protein